MSPLHIQFAVAMLGSLGAGEPVEPTVSGTLTEWAAPTGPMTSLALASAPTFAPADEDEGSPFSYTFLELGGYTQDLDGLSEDADNYQLKGSLKPSRSCV